MTESNFAYSFRLAANPGTWSYAPDQSTRSGITEARRLFNLLEQAAGDSSDPSVYGPDRAELFPSVKSIENCVSRIYELLGFAGFDGASLDKSGGQTALFNESAEEPITRERINAAAVRLVNQHKHSLGLPLSRIYPEEMFCRAEYPYNHPLQSRVPLPDPFPKG